MEKTLKIYLEELREQIAKDVEKFLFDKVLFDDDQVLNIIRGKR